MDVYVFSDYKGVVCTSPDRSTAVEGVVLKTICAYPNIEDALLYSPNHIGGAYAKRLWKCKATTKMTVVKGTRLVGRVKVICEVDIPELPLSYYLKRALDVVKDERKCKELQSLVSSVMNSEKNAHWKEAELNMAKEMCSRAIEENM